MSTPGESSGFEGIVDVSIVVPVTFDNPLKEEAVEFLAEVLSRRKRAIIPITSVIGAYHIATRYLRAPRVAVKKVLEGLLRTRSPALYPYVTSELAMDSLEYAATYNVESWDGYLIALSKSLGAGVIYSLDEKLAKVREITVVSPFPRKKVLEYHKWIKERRR